MRGPHADEQAACLAGGGGTGIAGRSAVERNVAQGGNRAARRTIGRDVRGRSRRGIGAGNREQEAARRRRRRGRRTSALQVAIAVEVVVRAHRNSVSRSHTAGASEESGHLRRAGRGRGRSCTASKQGKGGAVAVGGGGREPLREQTCRTAHVDGDTRRYECLDIRIYRRDCPLSGNRDQAPCRQRGGVRVGIVARNRGHRQITAARDITLKGSGGCAIGVGGRVRDAHRGETPHCQTIGARARHVPGVSIDSHVAGKTRPQCRASLDIGQHSRVGIGVRRRAGHADQQTSAGLLGMSQHVAGEFAKIERKIVQGTNGDGAGRIHRGSRSDRCRHHRIQFRIGGGVPDADDAAEAVSMHR